MHRSMSVLGLGAAAAFSILVAAGCAQAQDFENAKIEATDLGSGLYMMTGVGGNMLLSVGDDGAYLVDDQYAPLSEKIKAAIADITDQPVSYVINTHWHGDHTGGNENFGEAGAVIVAHDNVRARMSTEQFNEIFNRTTPPSPDGALPVITFSKDATFYFNGHAIRAIHVPHAHTDGDSVIHFPEANVIHAGDTLFNGRYPFIDGSSGGSIHGVIKALALILTLADEDTQIVPGHGPLATKADVENARTGLIEVRDAIAPLLEQGLSKEEIVAAKPLEELELGWEAGFFTVDQFVQIIVLAFDRPQ